MKRNSLVLYTLVLSAVPALASAQSWISSSPTANTHYGGALFNLTNTSAAPVQLTGLFDLNLSGAGGSTGTYSVYTKGSALAGTEMSAAPWTLLGSDTIASSNPINTFTTIDVGNTLLLAPGSTIGVAVFFVTPSLLSDTGGFVGYNTGATSFSDGTLTLAGGIAKGYDGSVDRTNASNLFNIIPSIPNRTFSGRVQYAPAPVPEPFSMAALGVGLIGLVARRRRSR